MNELVEIYTKSKTFDNADEIKKEIERIRTQVTDFTFELFPTPEARNAGKAIWNMLADFEEEDWYETVNSGTVQKWLQHYIEN